MKKKEVKKLVSFYDNELVGTTITEIIRKGKVIAFNTSNGMLHELSKSEMKYRFSMNFTPIPKKEKKKEPKPLKKENELSYSLFYELEKDVDAFDLKHIIDCITYQNNYAVDEYISNKYDGFLGTEETNITARVQSFKGWLLKSILADCLGVTKNMDAYTCGISGDHVWVHKYEERVMMIYAAGNNNRDCSYEIKKTYK